LLAWCGIAVWQIADQIAEARRHRAALAQNTQSSIRVLEAALRSVGRGRRQRPGFLDAVLVEVAAVPEILAAWLVEPDGEPLASTGDDRELPSPGSFEGAALLDDGLLAGHLVDIGPCLGGPGAGGLVRDESDAQTVFLFLLVDRTPADLEIAADRRLRIAVLVVSAAAALGAYLVIRGRTRTRHLRTELAVTEERAHSDREWALLGAGLAHETKNPLAYVRAAAQRLADENPAATTARNIVDEVDRVVARLNEFLHYSKPVEPTLTDVGLPALFDEVAALVAPDLDPLAARLDTQADVETVRADANQLRQILLNLLVNAARALGSDGRVELVAERRDRGTVRIRVRDNGRGIPREDIDSVFEPYTTRTAGGTGLGLAIVKRLAEAHGWSLRLESEPDCGTIVTIDGIEAA